MSAMSNAAKAIQLPEDLQAFAEERVRAGEYESVDEVASAALRLLQRRDERRAEVREELDGVFREMDGGKHMEPTDEEFAKAVRERAAKHQRG
jgi:putative addiction module CopG family antidote